MGVFNKVFGGTNIEKFVENKNFDGILKASAQKDLDIKKKAIQAFVSLGKSSYDYLVSNLGVSDRMGLGDKWKNILSAAVLKEMGWVPGSIEEKILFFMGLEKWENILDIREEAVGPLKQIVKTRNLDDPIRSAALITLGCFHKPEVADFMVEVLEESCSTDALDAQIVVACLKRMGGQAVPSLLAVFRKETYSEKTRIWASQILALIGEQAVDALIEINKNVPGEGKVAVSNWTFSFLALAGTAQEKALDYIKNSSRQGLQDVFARGKETKDLPSIYEREELIMTVLDVFKDPPRSIVNGLSNPDKTFQMISTLALGYRREAGVIKEIVFPNPFNWVWKATPVSAMEALDRIGGDRVAKTIIELYKSVFLFNKKVVILMSINKNNHPALIEFLSNLNDHPTFIFLEKAISSLTLIHLKRQMEEKI